MGCSCSMQSWKFQCPLLGFFRSDSTTTASTTVPVSFNAISWASSVLTRAPVQTVTCSVFQCPLLGFFRSDDTFAEPEDCNPPGFNALSWASSVLTWGPAATPSRCIRGFNALSWASSVLTSTTTTTRASDDEFQCPLLGFFRSDGGLSAHPLDVVVSMPSLGLLPF